jgi:hypothetical protein
MSQVLRYLGDLGGGMVGKEKKEMKEEVDEEGEGVASGGVATPVQAGIEDSKKATGGKKKKKGKGK